MIDSIYFHIAGPVVGKGRPRFARIGAGVRAYTPKQTASYENLVKLAASQQMRYAAPLDVPVLLRVVVHVDVPASWPEWKRAAALSGGIRPTGKPDADNIVKLLADALNGVVWRDDSQVVSHTFEKMYHEAPGLFVQVEAIDAMPANVTKRPRAA